MSGSPFQPAVEPPPSYGISTEFVCERCSRPRVSVVYQHPYNRMKYECPLNVYAPRLLSCPHFTREPGVD